MAKPDAQTDTRYSAEDLRKTADFWADTKLDSGPTVTKMIRQAAADAETLAAIRALLDDEQYGDEVIGKVTIRRALAED